jgi:uncharacterized protein (TIGR03083 family)
VTATTTADLLAALDDTYGRFGALLAGLGPAGWTTAVPATPGWTVADLVAHIGDGERAALACLQGDPPGELPVADVDAWTAAQVAAHRGEPPEQIRQRWEAGADAVHWHLAGLDEDGWRARTVWVAGPLTIRSLAQLRLQETWVHGRDVAEAVGTGWPAAPAAVAWMADLAARAVPANLTRFGRARPGATILLRLGWAGEWLVAGAAGPRPGPGTEPDLVLEADPLEFVLLSARRRREPPWVAGETARGDLALAADVAATAMTVG